MNSCDPLERDTYWMEAALKLAKKAAEQGEVPVGAVVVRDNVIIGEGRNRPIQTCDPTAHAEIAAIRAAAAFEGNYRLPNTTLYVTIEPCTMCLGAIMHARVERLVFGAKEPKAGVLASNPLLEQAYFNHNLVWLGGICESQCSDVIRTFFAARRKARKSFKSGANLSCKESQAGDDV